MGRRGPGCSICTDPQVDEINKRVVRGQKLAEISREFAVSEDALRRHREHVPQALEAAPSAQEIAKADSLVDELQRARQRTYDLLDKAEEAANTKIYGAPVQYLREIREQIKLLFELEGRIQSQPQINLVNIYQSSEWLTVGSILARILEPYPELRAEVSRELLALQEAHR
jgi:hypothetical protein